MGRNLFILAGTLGTLALIATALSFTNIAQQPGSPGDQMLWRTTGLVLVCLALVISLAGIFSSLFEQAERRDTEARLARRRKR